MENLHEKIILNADDFGRSPKANAHILSLASQGKLDRVSVMIARNFSEEEAGELLRTGVAIDLHLDLPSGARIYGHGRKSNALKGSLLFLLKYFLRQISPLKMEREWEEQLKKFQEIFGRLPDGINSHQHIHFFPAYFKVVLRLAGKYKINFIRFGKSGLLDNNNNIYPLTNFFSKLLTIKKHSKENYFQPEINFNGVGGGAYRILCRLHKKNERLFRASNLHSSDYMASLDWIRDFKKFSHNLPAGKIELACHPEREKEFEFINKYF